MPKGNRGIPRACNPRNLEKQREIMSVVCSYPGITLVGAAKLLDSRRSYIEGHAASMDRGGLLLSEDEDGGLYLFKTLELSDAIEWQKQIWSWGWNPDHSEGVR